MFISFLLNEFVLPVDRPAACLQLFKSTPAISATRSDETAVSSDEAEDTSEVLEHE